MLDLNSQVIFSFRNEMEKIADAVYVAFPGGLSEADKLGLRFALTGNLGEPRKQLKQRKKKKKDWSYSQPSWLK